jgi:predicted MFS family arabinose efflux permease
MVPLAATGLGRFAYALLLPDMRADLGWGYGLAGGLNAANGIGYLAGAVAMTLWAGRFDVLRVVRWSVALVILSLALAASTGTWCLLAILRFVAGVAGAGAFLGGAALATEAFVDPRRKHRAIGLYTAGMGLGVAIAGATLPAVLRMQGWRGGWLMLAELSAMSLLVLVILAPSTPVRAAPGGPTAVRGADLRRLAPLTASYFLFGLGYIGYMTFAGALIHTEAAGSGAARAFWVVLGLALTAATWVWPWLFHVFRGPTALMVILVGEASAAGLLVVSPSPWVILCSALLFGLGATSVVGAVTVIARTVLSPHTLLSGLSALTVAFAVGQLLGPVLCGVISDAHGLRAGFAASAMVLAIGGLVARAQPGPNVQHNARDVTASARRPPGSRSRAGRPIPPATPLRSRSARPLGAEGDAASGAPVGWPGAELPT